MIRANRRNLRGGDTSALGVLGPTGNHIDDLIDEGVTTLDAHLLADERKVGSIDPVTFPVNRHLVFE